MGCPACVTLTKPPDALSPTAAEIGQKLEWSSERTEMVREIVVEARRRHDEELLLYIEPDEVTDLLGEDELGGG